MPKTCVSVKPTGRKKTNAKACCNICLEDKYKRRMARLECGHHYCKSCIKKWAKHQNTCPQCRARFTHVGNKQVKETNQEETDQGGWDDETIRETMEIIIHWINHDNYKTHVFEEIVLGSVYHIHLLNRIIAGHEYFRHIVPRHIAHIFDMERRIIDMRL